MMGPTHALSGLAAGAATLPLAPVHTFPQQVAWTAVWGGMSMLPDLDQRSSTVSDMWGPLTETVSVVVGFLARGHRRGTHDVLVAPLVFGVGAYAAATHPWGALVVVALAIGLALRACHFVIPGHTETTILGNLALSAAGAWWIGTQAGIDTTWLPYAVAGGVVTHIAGDSLTTRGVPVPLTWIAGRPTMYGLPVADTNSWFEVVASVVFGGLAVWQLVVNTPLHVVVGVTGGA